MGPRFLLATVLALAVLVAIPVAFAGKPGNSPNAKLCQKTGWQTKARSDGSGFGTEQQCTSYAAQGGSLVSCTRVGTSGTDVLADAASGEVVCGFGGADSMLRVSGGDFYGGGGADSVNLVGDANDPNVGGTFNGGDGDDSVVLVASNATFNGGDGNDRVSDEVDGTFNGGDGDDLANDINNHTGILATYDGGPDTDTLCFSSGGTVVVNVEVFFCA